MFFEIGSVFLKIYYQIFKEKAIVLINLIFIDVKPFFGTISFVLIKKSKVKLLKKLNLLYKKFFLNFRFHLFHVITTFYVPLLIILLCYFSIGFSLRNQIAKRKILGNDSKRCQKTTMRFLLATICIICGYLIVWLPYQVYKKKSKMKKKFKNLFLNVNFSYLGYSIIAGNLRTWFKL